jgi:hypothetical protein
MAIARYNAKVQDKRLLELPEEADLLGLESGDEVEVSVRLVLQHGAKNETEQTSTPQERAKAFRAWADSHSHNAPLLSDDAISRESFYGERG